jgi:Rieske 2Fe-2S protein
VDTTPDVFVLAGSPGKTPARTIAMARVNVHGLPTRCQEIEMIQIRRRIVGVLVLMAVGASCIQSANPGTTGDSGAEPILEAPAVGTAIAGFRMDGTPFLVVRHADGGLTAVEAISPHRATAGIKKLLAWCPSSRTFDDVFHGARFDEYGRYLSGPAPTGLSTIRVDVLEEDPLRFRLADTLPPTPRTSDALPPAGPFCVDLEETPLVVPDVAESGLTPAALASMVPPQPSGSRWSVRAVLYVEGGHASQLCGAVVDGTCRDGAPVVVPDPDVGGALLVPAIWFVLVEDGTLADPIRAPDPNPASIGMDALAARRAGSTLPESRPVRAESGVRSAKGDES